MNDAISEPNRRLVFTARTGTDLQIILWIHLRITIVSGPDLLQRLWISPNEFKTIGVTCGVPTEALVEAAGAAENVDDKGSRREGRGCVRARKRRSTMTHGETEDAIPHMHSHKYINTHTPYM